MVLVIVLTSCCCFRNFDSTTDLSSNQLLPKPPQPFAAASPSLSSCSCSCSCLRSFSRSPSKKDCASQNPYNHMQHSDVFDRVFVQSNTQGSMHRHSKSTWHLNMSHLCYDRSTHRFAWREYRPPGGHICSSSDICSSSSSGSSGICSSSDSRHRFPS